MLKGIVRAVVELEPVSKAIRGLANLARQGDASEVFTRFDDDRLFKHLKHSIKDVSASQFGDRTPYVLSDRPVSPVVPGEHITSLDGLTDAQIREGVFFIYFECDNEALPSLRRITKSGGKYVPHIDFRKTDYRFTDRSVYKAMQKTWAKADRISHLNPIVHENICEALAITRSLPGDYVEIGVFRGGSALTALNYMDEIGLTRKAWLLDTFEGFLYPEADASPDAIWAGTHELDGVDQTLVNLKQTFAGTRTPYELVVANICADALPSGIKQIAVANIDVDMYEPTLVAMQKTAPLIPPGGIMICEDPASTPSLYGAYQAMEDFLDANSGWLKLFKKGQYFLLRTSSP